MRNKLTISILTAAVLSALLPGSAVNAHHSFSAEFDADTSGTYTGVVSEVRFSNPHVRYRIEVTRDDGSMETWELQAGSVTSLRPQGWVQDTIKVGDTITVDGQLGRNGSKKLFVRGLTLADGRGFGTASTTTTAPVDRNVVVANPDTNYGHGQLNPANPFDISGPGATPTNSG